jgi:hypothetical protein
MSLGMRPGPAHALLSSVAHVPTLTPFIPAGEVLAIRSGRGHDPLAIAVRGRSSVPVPLLVSRASTVDRIRVLPCTPRIVAPRARSHPMRRVRDSREDPPPY